MPDNVSEFLDQTWAGNTLRTYLVVLLVLALGWLGGRLAAWLLTRVVPRLTARTKSDFDDKLVARSVQPVTLLMLIAAGHVAVQLLQLPQRAHDAAVSALVVAAALTLAVLVMRGLDTAFQELMAPWAARQEPPVSEQVVHFGRIALKSLTGVFVMVTVLQRAGFDVVSVVTGLGIGGLAVALAAQETLGNVLGSLQIMTDRPFAVGDWIKVVDKAGRVVEIGMRSTKMLTSSGIKIVIPNKQIAQAPIENHTHAKGVVADFTIGFVYATPPAQLVATTTAIAELLRAHPCVHPDVTVQLRVLGESSLGLRVMCWITDAERYGSTLHELNLQILARVQELGVEFAFPTRTVHVAPTAAPAAGLVASGKAP